MDFVYKIRFTEERNPRVEWNTKEENNGYVVFVLNVKKVVVKRGGVSLHCKQFSIMYAQIRFSQAHILYLLHIFKTELYVMFCLELRYSVEKYVLIDAASQLSA